MCADCQFECTCCYCGERCDDEYLVYSLDDVDKKVENHDIPEQIKQDIVEDNAPICVYCFEQIAERELTKSKND
jgi:hypothetical protein